MLTHERSNTPVRDDLACGSSVFVPVVAIDGPAPAPVLAAAPAARPVPEREPSRLSPRPATSARLSARLPNGVKLELGGLKPESFLAQNLIVVSPGVPASIPELEAARQAGIPVWSEIELAWRFLRGKLIAITGSNGKTTTTSLVAHILRTAGLSTHMGGNIGTPLLSFVERSSDQDITVAEVRRKLTGVPAGMTSWLTAAMCWSG